MQLEEALNQMNQLVADGTSTLKEATVDKELLKRIQQQQQHLESVFEEASKSVNEHTDRAKFDAMVQRYEALNDEAITVIGKLVRRARY